MAATPSNLLIGNMVPHERPYSVAIRSFTPSLFLIPERSLLPHDIRLAGPWEFSEANSTDWNRCQLPWTAPDASNSYVIRRKFHRPTGLDNTSTLSLLIEASGSLTQIALNSEPISRAKTSVSLASPEQATIALVQYEFEVTTRVSEFNTVEIQLGRDTATSLNLAKLRINDNA